MVLITKIISIATEIRPTRRELLQLFRKLAFPIATGVVMGGSYFGMEDFQRQQYNAQQQKLFGSSFTDILLFGNYFQ